MGDTFARLTRVSTVQMQLTDKVPVVGLFAPRHVEWFKTRRLHSELGHVPPAEVATAHYALPRGHITAPTPPPT